MTPEALPWHAPAWRMLSTAVAEGRLGHALLIHGPRGVGKLALAERLSRLVGCTDRRRATDESDGSELLAACGACRSCRLQRAGTHPEAWAVSPEPERAIIAIDQVRGLIERISLTPQIASTKVVTIYPADALNQAAANALLKTLEEPPGSALLILVSDVPAALPRTIRSRCQLVGVSVPAAEMARAWLAENPDALRALDWVDGAPLEAERLAATGAAPALEAARQTFVGLLEGGLAPLKAARELNQGGSAKRVVAWAQTFLEQLIELKFGAGRLLSEREAQVLTPIVKRIEFADLYAILDELSAVTRSLREGIPLNEQLVMEGLALGLYEAVRAEKR